MGRRAKRARSTKRLQAKKQIKAARQALYASYAAQGKQRTRGSNSRRGVAGAGKGAHLVADCGNPGCRRCYPQLNNRTFGGVRARAS